MPKVQHPAFEDIALDVSDDALSAHLDAGWLLVITGHTTGKPWNGTTTVTRKGKKL